MNKIVVTVLLIAAIFAIEPPVYPEKYQIKFNQKASIGPESGTTKGAIYFDQTNNRQVITRENGAHDRFCGSVFKQFDTPCNHYVVEGKRFLDFPQKNYCCYCCNSTKGCGIVRRDWLVAANATYQGTQKLQDGQTYMKWDIKGLQDNLFYHKNDTLNTPKRLFQAPNDLQDFFEYKVGITDESVFNLPKYCTDTCGPTTFCASFRGQLIRSEAD